MVQLSTDSAIGALLTRSLSNFSLISCSVSTLFLYMQMVYFILFSTLYLFSYWYTYISLAYLQVESPCFCKSFFSHLIIASIRILVIYLSIYIYVFFLYMQTVDFNLTLVSNPCVCESHYFLHYQKVSMGIYFFQFFCIH